MKLEGCPLWKGAPSGRVQQAQQGRGWVGQAIWAGAGVWEQGKTPRWTQRAMGRERGSRAPHRGERIQRNREHGRRGQQDVERGDRVDREGKGST